MIRKVSALLVLVTLAAFAMLMPGPSEHRVYAQFAAQVPGFAVAATNATPPTVIGSGLAVTNPASNFLVLVQGGSVYCSNGTSAGNGLQETVGQSTLQLAASTTYQIEWNCPSQALYAKTAVTGPGSPSPNQPGVPLTILAPIPGVEIPIATVVCNATACGNGGNGTITDNRPLGNFPGGGSPLNTVTFAGLPTTNVTDGTLLICSSCAVAVGGASATCSSGAVTNLAIRQGGAWVCH